MRDQFGVGNCKDDPAFGTALINGKPVELVNGEHPHSYSDNSHYARFDSGRIIGFSGHRVCVSIEIHESNYIKDSELSGDDIRKACSLAIRFNGRPVFECNYRDHLTALRYASIKIDQLMEHPLNVWMDDWAEREVGRKVYYYETPATIARVLPEQNCVVVEPIAGHTFPRPSWADDWYDHDGLSIKDDIFSQHFNWFRDAKDGEE